MQILASDRCIPLDFQPRTPWPGRLPGIAASASPRPFWLAGFGQETILEIPVPVTDLLDDLYPKLSFFELARLHSVMTKEGLEEDFFNLYQKRRGHFNETVKSIFMKISQLPLSFQVIAEEKGLDVCDLRIFNAVAMEDVVPIIDKLSQFPFTKSELTRALEWGIEVIETGAQLPAAETKAQFLQDLHKLRFPNTSKKDAQFEEAISRFPWPKNVRAAWDRNGDAGHLSLEIKVHNNQELRDRISRLSHLIQKADQDLWKFH